MTTPATTRRAGAVEFPADFQWGVATASYQIEGATMADGRTPSIWDTFSRVPGAVCDGDNGDVACDHYRRMPEDVRLMADLGIGSYRFSVAWPRVVPDGNGVNRAGLAFYDRLVDELLAHDIVPVPTLYHWDLPQGLEDAGGWPNRDTAYLFVEHALATYDVLGDRVPLWTTLNEPWCSAFLGYTGGQHAPGRQEGAAGLRAAHHLMLAHGLAVEALRARGTTADIGVTLNLTVADPFDPTDAADMDAARRIDALHNRIFLDPLLRGSYPADLLEDTAHLGWTEVIRDHDLTTIAAPLDALGVNYYHGTAVSGRPCPDQVRPAGPPRPTRSPYVGAEHVTFPRRGLPLTDMGWEVQPEGLRRLLLRLDTDYEIPPVYITENGAAYPDRQGVDGSVHDPDRIAFLDEHLRQLRLAMEDGVDVRGYFQWSLMDNFEWALGYAKRFGIVYVDYASQARIPKSSARWYGEVCSTGRLSALPPTDG